MRAVGQYALALGHWVFGAETLALAHLYMGIDALTPLAVAREAEKLGIEVDELAKPYGITEKRTAVRKTLIAAHVRRTILFQGDAETHRRAKDASDGFEHGYRDFAEIRTDARAARDMTARYLREAVLDLGGVRNDVRDQLLSKPFDQPIRGFLDRYLWGRLVDDSDDLAPADREYPIIEWSSRLKEFKISDDGRRFTVTPEETFVGRFADGVRFEQSGFEIWGPASATVDLPQKLEAEEVRRSEGQATD